MSIETMKSMRSTRSEAMKYINEQTERRWCLDKGSLNLTDDEACDVKVGVIDREEYDCLIVSATWMGDFFRGQKNKATMSMNLHVGYAGQQTCRKPIHGMRWWVVGAVESWKYICLSTDILAGRESHAWSYPEPSPKWMVSYHEVAYHHIDSNKVYGKEPGPSWMGWNRNLESAE